MSEFKDFYYSIPFFTRWWLTCTVVLSILERVQFIARWSLILHFESIVYNFHIWRPFTALFFCPLSLHFLFCCYFIYSYSSRLETGIFAGKPADYLTMLIFCWLCSVIVAMLFSFPLLVDIMVMSVVYVWSLLHKDAIVVFWFGTRFKAMYLPWVICAFSFFSGGGQTELAGIAVGHLAYFLIFRYPQEFGGPMLLTPPGFLKHLFPDSRPMGGVSGAAQADPVRRPNTNAMGGHNWGRGNVLGGN